MRILLTALRPGLRWEESVEPCSSRTTLNLGLEGVRNPKVGW